MSVAGRATTSVLVFQVLELRSVIAFSSFCRW
jgi:hypothetical protein